jgi:hypothetical protein
VAAVKNGRPTTLLAGSGKGPPNHRPKGRRRTILMAAAGQILQSQRNPAADFSRGYFVNFFVLFYYCLHFLTALFYKHIFVPFYSKQKLIVIAPHCFIARCFFPSYNSTWYSTFGENSN